MLIGKYSITQNNSGTHFLEWYDKPSSRNMKHALNLEELFDKEVRKEFENFEKCAAMWVKCHSSLFDFLKDNPPEALYDHLLRNNVPNNVQSNHILLFEWNVKYFVEAYNMIYNCNLNAKEVEQYLKPQRNIYIKEFNDGK